jgi:hypothetical protein
MAGATRSRMRNGEAKQPVSPTDDGAVADDVPLEGIADYNAHSNAYTPSREFESISAHDDVSRLNEGLEPLHLVRQDSKLQFDRWWRLSY